VLHGLYKILIAFYPLATGRRKVLKIDWVPAGGKSFFQAVGKHEVERMNTFFEGDLRLLLIKAGRGGITDY